MQLYMDYIFNYIIGVKFSLQFRKHQKGAEGKKIEFS